MRSCCQSYLHPLAAGADSKLPVCAQVVQSTAHPVLRIDPAVFIPNDERVKRMGPVEAEDLRVMSYNVLWGLSAESATAKAASWQVTPVARETLGATASGIIADLQQLPVPITSRCYREHVLLRELLMYGSSVACLQEVTPGFDDFAVPMLAAHGYGYRRIRDGSVRKGSLGGELAMAWRAEQLEDECHATWKLCELLNRPWNADILSAMQPHQLAYMRRQPHMAQVRWAEDQCILLPSPPLLLLRMSAKPVRSWHLNLFPNCRRPNSSSADPSGGGSLWCIRISAKVRSRGSNCGQFRRVCCYGRCSTGTCASRRHWCSAGT